MRSTSGVRRAVLLAGALTTMAGLVLLVVRTEISGPLMRYGAVGVALGGVVLLGLSLVRRQPRTRRRAPAPVGRPRLTLVTSEPRA